MIKRNLFLKACALFARKDVDLTFISPDKISGSVSKDAVKDIIPIAVKDGYVISFFAGTSLGRFNFECYFDLPF